jgi:UDP-glucuronate 4-epimerase
METILVTGGAGFIGSNLIDKLLQEGHRIICVDNFDDTYDPKLKEGNISSFLKNKNFVLYREDIRNLENLRNIFEKEKPTHIIHLAAKADTRYAIENPYIYVSVNVEGTLNILELAKQFSVKRVIVASSSSVYGNNPNIPWKEEYNTDLPLSAYGATKKMTEMLAYIYHNNFGMSIICLRYFNVYGENVRPSMVPYKWAEAFLTGKEVELSGEGVRKRDFTYIGDVVNATILALTSSLSYEVINIANGQPVSLKELFSVFEKITGVSPKIRNRPSHSASANETFADSTKAKKLLGWEAKVSIEEGISKLIVWFREKRLENII